MKVSILVFILSFCGYNLMAQDLPHYPTGNEERTIQEYLKNKKSESRNLIPAPPPGPVRTMAEWEQVQAVIITWAGHSTILKEIVRHAVKECKVLIITTNPTNVTDQLTNAGIPMDSVQLVNTPFNSIWVRDYGPWSVYKNDVDSLFLIDWIYNRPREQDDVTPLAIADLLDIPIYEAITYPEDLVHTGGNHLPDGMGTAFSSMLILEENNDKTEAEIDTIVKKYLGVDQYIKFPTLPYDGIHHVDMHMRVIDEETIIWGEYPEGVADGPQINANIEYLQEFKTSFGNDYNIVRIQMPPEGTRYPDEGGDYRTYTNSIFINKTILVPTYEEKYDTTALRIYRENLPGYNVVGINCNTIIPSLGALHCITKLVGTTDPLWIAHPRLRDSDNAEREYPVTAIIKHRSGIAEASLYYRVAGDSKYSVVQMILADTFQNLWTAVIPPHANGVEVQYFIYARANSGKEQVRPIVAPTGYFNFRIKEEVANQQPTVNITYPLEGAVFDVSDESINIEFEAEDIDGEIVEAVVFVNSDSITTIDTLPYNYDWSFPGEGSFEIAVRVKDDKGSEITSDPVNIAVEAITANDEASESLIHFFPNPVLDFLWVINRDDIKELCITDLFGRKLNLPVFSEDSMIMYDFSEVPSGVYFMTSVVDDERLSLRIIKL